MRAHGTQPKDIVQPHARPDGRAPGHQHFATRPQKFVRDHKVFGGIGKDLKPVLGQNARGLDQTKYIRLQRVFFADDFKLDPPGTKDLARHMGGGDGFLDAVAAGGVGQHMHIKRTDQFPEILTGAISPAFAAQGYRCHRRTAAGKGVGQHFGRRVLRGAQHQTIGKRFAVETAHLNLPAWGRALRCCRLS